MKQVANSSFFSQADSWHVTSDGYGKIIFMIRDFTQIHKKYKGKWVALTSDEKTVISSGFTAKQVYDNAQSKGFKEPILMKVPKDVVIYVGFVKLNAR